MDATRGTVMAQTRESVAGYAYILAEIPVDRRTAWHRVELMRPEAVTALAMRRNALLAGEVDARCVQLLGIYQTCVGSGGNTIRPGGIRPHRT